ncbi:MAG: LTA synthase family protein [Bacteroidales bacterium]|nr:LTA synthase family protein [Bacteroidales bacterium]
MRLPSFRICNLTKCADVLVSALSLFIIFLYLESSVFTTTPSLLFKIAAAVADSSLFVLLISALRGNRRIAGGALVFVIMLVVLANVLYLRSFNDLIPSTAYFHSQLTDPTVLKGASYAFRPSDMILIAAGILPLAYYFIRGRKQSVPAGCRSGLIVATVIVMIAAWSVSLLGTYRRNAIYNGEFSFKEITQQIFSKEFVDWRTPYRNLHFTGYLSFCVGDFFSSSYITLSDSQKEEIRSYLSAKTQETALPPLAADSVRQNLIIIVVESLESQVMNMYPDIHPTLSAAIAEPNTVYVERCKVQADYGRSSDAQFILNTGLLPLHNEALVNRYAMNDYPSLAKALGSHSIEIIGEDKSLWSHGQTSQSYGFETLIDNICPDTYNQDSLIFKEAAREAARLPEPFFMFVSTLSMHDPYTDAITSAEIGDVATDPRDMEYFRRLKHFDTQLGSFIDSLKAKNLYDNSLIVIVGDHEIREDATSLPKGEYVPLIILNSPAADYRREDVSQADIFPTNLYLMGKDYSYRGSDYTGVGTNIFYKSAAVGSDDRAYKVSEQIIRSKME